MACVTVWVAMTVGAAPAIAAAADKSGVDFLLQTASPETVTRVRENCALGQEPAHVALLKQAGVAELPDMVGECVAALARLGHDGTLGYIRDTRVSGTTPALSFDSGFVNAYRKREAVPPSLPSMAAVQPIAERCLGQSEPDTGLCTSAGYVYGARIANGEAIGIR
jgi:hypothetical protein